MPVLCKTPYVFADMRKMPIEMATEVLLSAKPVREEIHNWWVPEGLQIGSDRGLARADCGRMREDKSGPHRALQSRATCGSVLPKSANQSIAPRIEAPSDFRRRSNLDKSSRPPEWTGRVGHRGRDPHRATIPKYPRPIAPDLLDS